MRLIRVCLITIFLMIGVHANDNESININFKDLKIVDLVKITSKIINKNILLTTKIKGNVDFISNKPVRKKDILNVLLFVLESKGYTIVDNDDIIRIVKINDTAKYNVPVFSSTPKHKQYQIITEIFKVNYVNVDYVASKVKHLISKSAKLVTDKESNTIVITDFEANIKTVKKIISIITRDNKKSIEVIRLKNIDASLASKTLDGIAKNVFPVKVEKEKVVVLANKDDNSLMLIGKKNNVRFLKNYIEEIDQKGSLVKKVVEVLPLKNVEASSVIKIIDSIIGKKKYIDENSKPFASVDEESNSIVVMGPGDEVKYIKELIAQLDKDKLQVYVKARIIEVSETLTKNVGLKYGITGFNKGGSGNLASFSSSLNGGTIPTIADFGLTASALSNSLALGAAINLLKENNAIDVISEPSILCINNKESSIYVGETKSFQTGTTTNTSGTTTSFTREDIGLTLKVKPRISNQNKVTLTIETIVEDAQVATADGANPDTSKKEIKTTAIVNNGESVIIGGLIKSKETNIESSVPFFSDIPIFGELFKNNNDVKDKVNLVVIITPYIIPKSSDLTSIRNKVDALKAVEERYLAEALIRLKEEQIKGKKEELRMQKKEKELDKELESLSKNINLKVPRTSKSDISLSSEERHKKMLKENFGL